jgi:hypothetical protein
VIRLRLRGVAASLMLGSALFAPGQASADQQHGLAIDYQFAHLTSKEGSSYHFQSPGLSYLVLVGSPWAFQGQLTALLPVKASQDGKDVDPSTYYSFRFGLDLEAGIARRFKLRDRLEASVGAGAHLNGLILPGASGYQNFTSLTLGLALTADLRYAPWGTEGFHTVFGAFATGALDFIDLIHGEDLRAGDFVTAGLFVAWSFG